MTRFIQYPFDKTKMTEVREWANGVGLKDVRAVKGVKNVELSFCPGEGWLAARYILCADALARPRTPSQALTCLHKLSHPLASHAPTRSDLARSRTLSHTLASSHTIAHALARSRTPWPRTHPLTACVARAATTSMTWWRSATLTASRRPRRPWPRRRTRTPAASRTSSRASSCRRSKHDIMLSAEVRTPVHLNVRTEALERSYKI